MGRRRPLESGFCEVGNHPKCSFHMQTANEKRPAIDCACKCHKDDR